MYVCHVLDDCFYFNKIKQMQEGNISIAVIIFSQIIFFLQKPATTSKIDSTKYLPISIKQKIIVLIMKVNFGLKISDSFVVGKYLYDVHQIETSIN